MNFKSLVFIAGAVALATASSFEESTQELAQAECHPGYSRCSRCFGAAAKRANRYRAIINWRNAHNKANHNTYHSNNRYRIAKSKYWRVTWPQSWASAGLQFARRCSSWWETGC